MRWMLVFVLTMLLATRSVAQFMQPVSLADVRADMDRADYRAARVKIDRILMAPADSASQDRYELLMTKGECELQLASSISAASAFRSAAKEAADVNQYAAATANAVLIGRATLGKYSSPSASISTPPIDIVSADSRKQAMRALAGDIWARSRTQIQNAIRSNALPSLEQAFTPLSEMYFLEIAADGDAKQAGQPMRDLTTQVYQLMAAEIRRGSDRVNQLDALANSSADIGRGWGGRRGLWTPERNELKNLGVQLRKLRDQSIQYREVARGMKGDVQKWDTLVADASRAVSNAEIVWNTRY